MKTLESNAKDVFRALGEEFSHFSFSERRSRLAFKMALSVTLSAWLVLFLDFDSYYVAALGSIIATFPNRAFAFTKICHRVAGAVCGCFFSFFILGLLIQQHFLFGIALFLYVTLCIYWKHSSRYPEFWYPAALMFLIPAYSSVMRGEDAFSTALFGAAGFAVGAIVSFLVNIILFPEDTSERLRNLDQQIHERFKEILQKTLNFYMLPDTSPALNPEKIRQFRSLVDEMEIELRTAREENPSILAILDSMEIRKNCLEIRISDLERIALCLEEKPGLFTFQFNYRDEIREMITSLYQYIGDRATLDKPDLAVGEIFIRTYRQYEAHYRDDIAHERHRSYSIRDVLMLHETVYCLNGIFRDLGGVLDDTAMRNSVTGKNENEIVMNPARSDFMEIETGKESMVKVHIPSLETGIKGGLGVFCNFWLFFILDLPSQEGTTFSTSVISLFQVDTLATFRKGILRISGCATGILIAFLYLGFQPTSAVLFFFFLFVYIYAVSCIMFSSPRISYLGTQAGISFLNVVMDSEPVPDLSKAIERPICILLGVGVAWVINYVLFPKNLNDSIVFKIRQTWEFLDEIFQEIRKYLKKPSGSQSHFTINFSSLESAVHAVKAQENTEPVLMSAVEEWMRQVKLLNGELNELLRMDSMTVKIMETVSPEFPDHLISEGLAAVEGGVSMNPTATADAAVSFRNLVDSLMDHVREKQAIASCNMAEKQAFAHAVVNLIRIAKRLAQMAEMEKTFAKG